MTTPKATLCTCKTKHWIPEARQHEAMEALKAAGFEVEEVDDLCRLVMEAPAGLQDVSNTFVVACHPRAVESLFQWRGLKATQLTNLRSQPTQDALKAYIPEPVWRTLTTRSNMTPTQVPPVETTQPSGTGNEGWFPVIDKQRCINCGRCYDFCLFGVYTKIDHQVVVAQPDKCKNNCPACARMCPERAIIFPKYDKSPINGGLEEEETFSAESMEALYNERLRYKLQERRQSVSLLKKP